MKSCDRCSISRRQFLQVAGAATCLAFMPFGGSALASTPVSRTPVFPKGKARVTLVFVHAAPGKATWPSINYDYSAREAELSGLLSKACPEISFTVRRISNNDQASAVIKESSDCDGYLVYVIGLAAPGAEVIVRSGKPVILVDDLFGGSGQVLRLSGTATREKLPVVAVSSSSMKDVISAAKLFGVIRAMKETKILDVTNRDISAAASEVKSVCGAELVRLSSDELASYYSKADADEATEWADYWIAGARRVVEPPREEIIKSARMYLALCRAAAERRADAVTVDCLGLFYSGKIPAYPCLGFFQMNNDGGTGVCEGDVNSTCTQLIMRYMTGRPGYVSDPVIDTSRGEVIYAHCVSTNRVYGPKGKANPYIIRSHAEDQKGASVQSLMPEGDTVTTLIMNFHERRMVVHTGKAIGNSDEPKACRTKLVVKANAKPLLRNWDLGWHRVTVYGDWKEQAMNISRLLGIDVFEEDKA